MSPYEYVGSDEIRASVSNFPIGAKIRSIDDLKTWLNETSQKPNGSGLIPATFVVDTEGYLRLADRHSEHVACAGGASVLSAGEIFFSDKSFNLEVVEITNQSTGYCPEPESWQFVAKALDRIPVLHPGKFTTPFLFRRCLLCQQLNIIKNNLFACAVCHAELPR